MRIISLVPSLTEALFDFGLNTSEVVGRTKFCIHPEDLVKQIPIIGGTKNLNLEKIKALQPDLIIANKEENDKNQIEELTKSFNVWITDITNLEDNDQFLKRLGEILQKTDVAENYAATIERSFSPVTRRLKTAYLIWQNPYMTIGNDTFIHDVMARKGLDNIFGHLTRYPEIHEDDLKNAELILLSTEPFPFKESHVQELQQKFPDKKVLLADGEAFSWYGTHLSRRKDYFKDFQRQIFR